VKELGNKYTIGSNDDLSIFKNKFNTDNGITTQPVTTNAEQLTQATGQKKFTIGDNTDLDKFKAKFNQPQNKGTYSDAIEAQRLSVASPVSKANTQPIQTVKPVTNGMPSKAQEYETRVNYAPVPATVPQMSYADFKKQEYNIPEKNTIKPYENRGRYIVVDNNAAGQTPGVPTKEPVQKVPDNQPSWGKVGSSSILGGIAQTQTGMFNVPRKIIEGVSIGLDKVLPDFIYNKEMQNNDPIKNALDKAVKSNEERAMQYQKDLEGAKGLKGFVAAGLPALPQIVMAAFGGAAASGSSALSGLPTVAKQLIPFGTLAAGGYAKEAENDGASYGQQVAYGLLGGTAEAATEVIPLGNALNLMKKFAAGEIAEKGAKTLIGKYGKTAMQIIGTKLSEGLQEAIMSPIGGGLKKLTYDQDMKWTGKDGVVDWKDIKDSFYVGISMAVILGGLALPSTYAAHKLAAGKIESEDAITPDFIQNELMPALQKDTAAIENENNQAAKIQQAPAEFNWALNQVISGKNIPAALEAKYPVLVEFKNNLEAEKAKPAEIQNQAREKETNAIAKDYNSLFDSPQKPMSEVEDKPIKTIEPQEKDNLKALVENEEKPVVEEPVVEKKTEEEIPKIETEKTEEVVPEEEPTEPEPETSEEPENIPAEIITLPTFGEVEVISDDGNMVRVKNSKGTVIPIGKVAFENMKKQAEKKQEPTTNAVQEPATEEKLKEAETITGGGMQPQNDKDTISIDRTASGKGVFTAKRGDYVDVSFGRDKKERMKLIGISNAKGQVRVADDKYAKGQGIWVEKGSIYPEYSLTEKSTQKPKEESEKKKPLSEIVDSINKKYSPDGGFNETDRVNKETEVKPISELDANKRATNFLTKMGRGEEVTFEVAKEEAQFIIDSEEAIKAELSKMKNDDLKKKLSYVQRGQYSKKDEMVKAAYDNMLSLAYYNLSGETSISYTMDGSNYFDMLKGKVKGAIDKLTPESLEKNLGKYKKQHEESSAKWKARIEGLKEPKTLEDFENKKHISKLTPEEQDKYEDMLSRDKREKRQADKVRIAERKATVASKVIGNTDKLTITKDKHSKTQEDVWVVKLNGRLESEEWKAINDSMKALGGSWWRGNQGWNFKSDPTEKLQGDVTKELEAKAETRLDNRVAKLREVADNMQNTIDDKFKDRLANTTKRAGQAASAEAEGESMQRLQQTLRNIADALENEKVELIGDIDSRAQLETLNSILSQAKYKRIQSLPKEVRGNQDKYEAERAKPSSNEDIRFAEMPVEEMYADTLKAIAKDIAGKKGFLQIAARLQKAVVNAKEGKVIIDYHLRADLDKLIKELGTTNLNWVDSYMAQRKRLERMGIETVEELKAYLREYLKYKATGSKVDLKQKAIKDKERNLIGKKIEGYFPTPKAIVEQMLDNADIQEGDKILEPSAGKGNIADMIKEQNPDNTLDVIEYNRTLSELLTDKGYNVVGDDFLKHTGEYDKIIMNPPFEKGQDMDHVTHAFELLKPGGKVVAIMSPHFTFAQDKQSKEFRDFLEGASGSWDKLPEGSFKSSERPTGVNTVMVVIEKPAEVKVESKAISEEETFRKEMNKAIETKLESLNQEPRTAAEQRKEFEAEVSAEKKMTNKQIEERVKAIEAELEPLKQKQNNRALDKTERQEISDKIVDLLSERNALESRVAQIIETPKTNTDKLQNALINEQLSIEGIEIAKGKRYGFDYSQREQIAEELIEGSKTDAQKINIKVRNDGTMNVVNSEPIIADVMNELGIKKAEPKIPFNMDKNAGTSMYVDKNNMWASPNGFYAAKVTEEEIQAMKDYAEEKKIQYAGETDFTKNLMEPLKEANTELTEMPKEQETIVGKRKERWYVFKVGDKLYTVDKSYFDLFNKDGNRFYVSNSAVMPMAVKDSEGNLIGSILPARTKVTQEQYEELNPATGKDFFSKAKLKPNKSGVKSSAMTGALPQMPLGDDSATLGGKDGAKTVDEIVSIIEKTIEVPIRTGKFRQKAYGIFKQLPEVIRTKVTNDLPTISHEVGHYLDKLYDLAQRQFDMELQALGQVTSRKSYTKEQIREEGVAEFVRLYLTDPQQATLKAPNFLVHFESSLNAELLKELNDLRREIGKANNLPPTEKVLNDISIGESRKSTKENSISGFLQKFYDAWLDEFEPINRAYRRAVSEGWTGKNVSTMAKVYRGFEAKVKANLKYAQTDLAGNVVGESLENILKPIRKQYKEFITYMVSRRAVDYEDKNFVMPQPYWVYQDNVTALETKYPHFKDVFDNLRKWEDNNIHLLAESGIKTEDTIDEIKKNNPNHVPLYRIQEAVDSIRAGSGNTMGQSKKVIKKAKGSGKTIIDPIESLIADAFIIRRAAEANDILRTLANISDSVEGFGDIMEAVSPGLKATTFNVEEISKTLENMGIDTEGVDLDKLVTIFRVNYSERPNEITVYRNGKAKLYQMESEIYKAIKGLNRQASHILIRILNVPKRVIQAGAVTTVQFVMRNIARDTQTSLINSEFGINPIDIIKGYASAIKKDKWFKQWILTGGASEYIQVADRTNVQGLEADILGLNFADKVKELLNNPTKKNAIRVLLAPMRAIREGIEWSEAGPRVAEMRKATEKGSSKEEAAALSRDLSQDFLRYGYYGKEYNKVTAFFNANLQGIEKQIRVFKEHPYRTLVRGLMYVTLPTMILYFINDDNDEYKRMAEWRKALFYNIPLGNRKTTQHFLSIPKPYGWGFIFGALPEIILDEIRRDEPDTWKKIKEGFATNYTVPTMISAVGPLFEVETNKSWNQKPIESKADEMKPAYLRYSDYTSTLSKGIAAAAKDANISPKKLDYLVKGYTGSVGDFFWRLPDTITKTATEGIDVTTFPVIRAFMTDTVYSNDTLDTFYNYGTELNQRKMEADETGTYRAISKLPQNVQEQVAGSLKNARTEYNAVAKSFSEAKKIIMEIQHSDKFSPAEKKLRTREVQIKIVKKAEVYNKKYAQFKQKIGIK
jgi:hypothetical protein